MTTEEKKKSKELLNRLHAKYYGKKTQKSKVATKTPKEAKAKEPSRNQLMLQAKAKGIKNFRILNKEELGEVLKEGATKERIGEVVIKAVARWKSGWKTGKRKEKTGK